MKLEVLRFNSADDFTNGILFDVSNNKRKFLAYTLEDEARTVKVAGETRIPSGEYNLSLRKEGGFDTRYKSKFSFHIGMIHVDDVPNFKYILWHIGNDDDDTAGCLLLGKTSQDGFIGSSTVAYSEVYKYVAPVIESGEKVTVKYIDYDGDIISNKATDYKPPAEDNVLEELKQIKTELTALRKAWILKGLQVD
tara:strand:+ start:370 stop:951 length:582 start_codon:yes stop_codon:yes gene_type:complete